ncbi:MULTISPECIES: TauD/TfdA dioxygenase family protein [unclassified Sphingomonas]|uniref:TauD/TfdA dioxygenase family protein n=1 Tax=unclassified Sphingomonas TaxID=196159 RepID=UPI000700FB1F|nr:MULTISPECIES: TauD/TfdA family dioxygenase [unclassified Sphingomonas]KQX19117.1 2,4-dichlorophenoxyacetate dioxygenase [Sphingomonas sp. Root1294]KQY65318.1 2,4-dichlorophenoxyacetate dioxygenase [Sphingomonas sp. Root50]KRB95387.1 2,4-dichlorophenoxyacetate dioxygenase [Sphingomonas sp. Root720]
MTLSIAPLSPGFVAELSGVDLREKLDDAVIEGIVKAIDRYAVVVFRGQPLTEEQQIAFAERFGPLDIGLKRVSKAGQAAPKERLKNDILIDISNVDADGRPVQRTDPKIVNNIANQLWHSDSSFQSPPAAYSMLSAQTVARKGGDTEFADMRAAYDALDEDMKAELVELVGEHFALHSREILGADNWTQAQKDAIPRVHWPIVRSHPGSGRKLLFIGAHACRVLGMTVPEGRMLLQDLLEHATQREFVYRHKWTVDDLVIWDNRATLHRGRRFDFTEKREMRRSTTVDASGLLPAAA